MTTKMGWVIRSRIYRRREYQTGDVSSSVARRSWEVIVPLYAHLHW